jgi:hypothetical protein
MRTTLLLGNPGSGKTTMACLTAVRRPVFLLDVDWKARSMANLEDAIKAGQLTYREVDEAFQEEDLEQSLKLLTANKKPTVAPRGWSTIARLIGDMDRKKDAAAAAAQTWVLDSWSRLVDHLDRDILYLDPNGTAVLSQRDWGHHNAALENTLSRVIAAARRQDKDLIITSHLKVVDLPGPHTKVIRTATGRPGESNRELLGTMDLRFAPSVGGQFAMRMGAFFEEVYRVEGVNGQYRAYVRSDGRYDLRSSFKLDKPDYPADFRQIWQNGRRNGRNGGTR